MTGPMAVTRPLAVTGAGFPVPLFAAAAAEGWGPVQELRSRPELRLVTSPRHAGILLVAGAVPEEHCQALDRVHDQVPHPRRTVTWTEGQSVREVTAAVVDAFRHLLADPSSTEPDSLPDEEPNEWRGIGPHGQGGEGMMGGTPYGRPMPMTGEDRDGLALDQLHLRLGPFLDAFPPGLVLDVTLQGEVLQSVEAHVAHSTSAAGERDTGDLRFSVARPGEAHPAPVVSELRWLAHGLHVHGLDAHAATAARLAVSMGEPGAGGRDLSAAFASLRRRLRWSGLRWTLQGVGPVDGFGDAAGRWQTRLDQIADGLSGRATPPPLPPVITLSDLSPVLEGMTFTDAVTTLVSFGPALDRSSSGAPA